MFFLEKTPGGLWGVNVLLKDLNGFPLLDLHLCHGLQSPGEPGFFPGSSVTCGTGRPPAPSSLPPEAVSDL